MTGKLANANSRPGAQPAPAPRAGATGVRVFALQTGTVRVKSAQVAPTRRGMLRIAGPLLEPAWAGWLPTFAWLIDHPEGPIVVDTGAAAHLLRLPRWHPYFRLAVRFAIEPEEEVGPRLRAFGLDPRDVRTVVLTHMHIDHDAGLHHFPSSVPSSPTRAKLPAQPGSGAACSGTCRSAGRRASIPRRSAGTAAASARSTAPPR